MNRILIITVYFFLMANLCSPLFGQMPMQERLHGGVSVGMGLPKIPFSHFRTPVSLVGSGMLNYRLGRKIGIQLEGGGLTTINLGTAGREQGELKFDFLWSSFDFLWRARGEVRNESFLAGGVGYYHLVQQYDDDKDDLNTMGMNLGLVSWAFRNRWIGIFDVRWHLLFEPSNHPQVLILSFGILF
jgi:hypothetical protein